MLSAVLYGCLVFVVMNFVVVPLSAARVMRITLVNLVNGFLGHIISVGLPCLWAVHATRPQATAARVTRRLHLPSPPATAHLPVA